MSELNADQKTIKALFEDKKVDFLIFFEDERYLVILEERANYMLLITAYYLEYDNALEKQKKHYDQYKAEGAPHNGTPSETPSTTGR